MTKDKAQGYYDVEHDTFVHVHPALIELQRIAFEMTDEQTKQLSRWCHRWLEDVYAEQEIAEERWMRMDTDPLKQSADRQLQSKAGMAAAKASGFIMEKPWTNNPWYPDGLVRRLRMMIVRNEPLA